VSKDGYEKREEEVSFTKRNRTHVVYLNRSAELNETEIMASVDDRWAEPIEISDDRLQTSEIMETAIDLGVTTNILLEEDDERLKEMDLGITTNELFVEERVEPQPENSEQFDLGVNTNEQFDEQPSEPLLQEPAQQQSTEEIEQTIEAALAEAEPSTVNSQLSTEPEPEFSEEKFKRNNVLLLLDVSGSMKDDGKMDKLKSSIRRLVMMLREVDVLTMIAYNSDSWEVLPPTPVTDNLSIVDLVDSLQASGYTNGVKGMETAYQSLEKQLIAGGNNQLIIATDGKFNSSKFSEEEAVQLVKSNSDKGIVLSIIGFGDDREAGRLMRKLANLGDGSFMQVDKDQDPTELLAEEIKLRSLK
ncbi:MAG: VWA domain-containing protein, partial [Bacteroidetes bacterium]